MNSLSTVTAADSPRAQEKRSGGTLQARLALGALGLLVGTVWILQRPYRGLNHDSILYTFLALARLHPQSLLHDLFLRFGSQDSFTLFSPIYAAAARAFDLEPSAALLTLLGQAAFFLAAWALARRVMSAPQALLAVGLLIALPSDYGAHRIFGYIEGFLTPRQLGEAFALAGVAAVIAERPLLGIAFLCAGMLMHPIMAFAAFILLFCLYRVIPRPRIGLALITGAFGASLAIALLSPVGPFRSFDATWFEPIRSFCDYLFVSKWDSRDWSHLVIPAGVLVIGLLTTTTPLLKKLCSAALLMSACGLLASLVFCDLLHVVIFTQVQPWRWVWLAQVIALLLLPVIIPDCWRAGRLGPPAILLLVSAWEFRDLGVAPVIVLAAIACATNAARLKNERHARLVLLGCGALVFISIVINLLPHTLHTSRVDRDASTFSQQISQWLSIWAGDGLLYGAVLGITFWLGARHARSAGAGLLATAVVLTCILLPAGWHSWTTYQYTPALRAAYAPWRSVIPEQAQVLWPGSPVAAWYLLERADYWSLAQIAGDIFSREKALEGQRRSRLVQTALEASGASPPVTDRPALPASSEKLNARGMAVVCSDPELSFVVTWSDLGPTSFPPVTPDPARLEYRMRLYRCADVRQAGP